MQILKKLRKNINLEQSYKKKYVQNIAVTWDILSLVKAIGGVRPQNIIFSGTDIECSKFNVLSCAFNRNSKYGAVFLKMADMWGRVGHQGKFQVKSRAFLAKYLANSCHLSHFARSSFHKNELLEEPRRLLHKFPFSLHPGG